MKYRSVTRDDSWMGLSFLVSCKFVSHWHASKCQLEIVGVGMPGKQSKDWGQF